MLCHHREKRDMEKNGDRTSNSSSRGRIRATSSRRASHKRFPQWAVFTLPEHFVKFYEPSPVAGRNVSASLSHPVFKS